MAAPASFAAPALPPQPSCGAVASASAPSCCFSASLLFSFAALARCISRHCRQIIRPPLSSTSPSGKDWRQTAHSFLWACSRWMDVLRPACCDPAGAFSAALPPGASVFPAAAFSATASRSFPQLGQYRFPTLTCVPHRGHRTLAEGEVILISSRPRLRMRSPAANGMYISRRLFASCRRPAGRGCAFRFFLPLPRRVINSMVSAAGAIHALRPCRGTDSPRFPFRAERRRPADARPAAGRDRLGTREGTRRFRPWIPEISASLYAGPGSIT